MIYKPMKRFFFVLSAAALLFAGCCDKKVEAPRNVILIVGDGMGVAQVYASVVAEKGDNSAFLRFQDYDLVIKYGPRMSAKPLGCCYVIELREDKFLLVGLNCTPEFRVKPGDNSRFDIMRLEEGRVVKGKWIPGRVLNGDEKMALRFGDMPSALMVELYRF